MIRLVLVTYMLNLWTNNTTAASQFLGDGKTANSKTAISQISLDIVHKSCHSVDGPELIKSDNALRVTATD